MNSHPPQVAQGEVRFWIMSLFGILVTIWMIMALASASVDRAPKANNGGLQTSILVSDQVARKGFVNPGKFNDTPEDRARVADYIERSITQHLCPEKSPLCPLARLSEGSESELRAFKYLAEQGPNKTMDEAIKQICAEDSCLYINIFYRYQRLMENVIAKQEWAESKTAYIVGKKESK